MRSRIVLGAAPGSVSSGGTSAGGGGGGVPSRFSSIHLPRSVGAVRSACDVAIRIAALAEQPAARSSSGAERDAAEPAAVDVRDAVVPREALVDERVVGRHAGRARSVVARRCSRRTAPSRARTACRKLLSKSGKAVRVRLDSSRGCAGAAIGPRSSPTSAAARGSREHAPHLLASSTPGSCSRFRPPRARAARRRDAAPQEEREPRGELEVADAIRGARRRVRGILLRAKHERRAREQTAQRELDARVERARPRPSSIERHEAREVRLVDGPPIRAPRERRQDLARAALFVGRARRRAGRRCAAALAVVAGAGRRERPDHVSVSTCGRPVES